MTSAHLIPTNLLPPSGPTSESMVAHRPATSNPIPSELTPLNTEVRLKPYQEAHVQKVLNIWQRHFFAIDNSVMGSGKTHSSSYLAQVCKFPYIVVVCPAAVENTWKVVRDAYQLPISLITSYESLRSFKNSQPKHGLLSRTDDYTGANFAVTDTFKTMVDTGCLLIADEFQRVKNKNDQYIAFKALSQHIYYRRGQSRCLLLSGTPFDKKEQVVNMLQMVGVIRSHRLFVFHKEEIRLELLGAQELVDYCETLDRDATHQVLRQTPFHPKNVYDVCYNLYINIIQKEVVSAMPSPDISVPIECYNGYYNMTPEGSRDLQAGITLLHRAARYDVSSGKFNGREMDWGAITTAIRLIQTAKCEIFIREAKRTLDANPNAKVALFFDFDEPIRKAMEGLAPYNPIAVTGKVNKLKRPALISKFQEHNTVSRLLIFNMSVGCEGIDLDDTHGMYPRYAWGAPNYFVMRMHQMTRRFHRANTRSKPTISFVYGKCGKSETSIINALSRKTMVMKDTLTSQVAQGVVFVSEYPKYIEPDSSPVQESKESFNLPVSFSIGRSMLPTFTPSEIEAADLQLQRLGFIDPPEEPASVRPDPSGFVAPSNAQYTSPISSPAPKRYFRGSRGVSPFREYQQQGTPSPLRGLQLKNIVLATTMQVGVLFPPLPVTL